MAHGGQESTLGLVGQFGLFLGFQQLLQQVFAFRDVDAAADDAHQLAARILVGADPVVDAEALAAHPDFQIPGTRDACF